MIFLTLGTYPLAFDRLLIAIDDLCGRGMISDELFGQIGHTDYEPKFFPYTKVMVKEKFDELFNDADEIISPAGMGSISMALEWNKPLLVMPRLAKYREVVNDHQVGTARRFEALGHIIAVFEISDLPENIAMLKTFEPKPRKNQVDRVATRIKHFLEDISI